MCFFHPHGGESWLQSRNTFKWKSAVQYAVAFAWLSVYSALP